MTTTTTRERSALCASCEAPCFPRGNMAPDLCEDCAHRAFERAEREADALLLERDTLRGEKAELARLFASRSQEQAERIADMSFALRRLLDWERGQGGYEAPCWAYARTALNRLQ